MKSDEPAHLYGLPLEEFVAARDQAARAARKAGDREAAAELAALRKPTVAAWAVNQLSRQHRGGVEALIAAAEAIRKGNDEGDERFRQAVDTLTRTAREILAAADRRTTDTVLQEVATTLRATAAVASTPPTRSNSR